MQDRRRQAIPGGRGSAQFAGRREVAALGDAAAVKRYQRRGEPGGVLVGGLRREFSLQVPVAGRLKGDPLLLPLHDEPYSDGLHAPGRQLGHDLLPQHGRDLVAVEPVEHAAGLVGLDQAVVHVPWVGDRGSDRLRRDLVEDHPPGRNFWLEFLDEVPGDRLALPVLVGGEQEFVGILQQLLELADLLALVGVDHVERLEVGIDVDPEPGPRLLAQPVGNVSSAARHVTDVADARFDHIALAEVPGDRARLGWRLDDDKPVGTVRRRGRVHLGGSRRRAGPCCHDFLPHISRASWSALVGHAAARPLRRQEATAGDRLPPRVRAHRSSVPTKHVSLRLIPAGRLNHRRRCAQ